MKGLTMNTKRQNRCDILMRLAERYWSMREPFMLKSTESILDMVWG